MKYITLIISLLPIICSGQDSLNIERKLYGIFSGKVISITESHQKEGTFAEIKVEVDSIIQLDTATNELPGYYYYLNEKRVEKHNNKKPLIVTMLVEPELCNLQVCMRYIIYTNCCNVDSYYYDPKRTKQLDN
ncbi:MAG: hypothetical protein HRT71_19580 [Flavobacteriales bacterium]|nr:hypothetical protein [Flavobacteriales bacterium]